MIKDDLECLLNVSSNNDDITYLVYMLLKDTRYKEDLLMYRKLCLDKDLERKLDTYYANRHQSTKNTKSQNTRGFSFEDWVSRQRGGSSI